MQFFAIFVCFAVAIFIVCGANRHGA